MEKALKLFLSDFFLLLPQSDTWENLSHSEWEAYDVPIGQVYISAGTPLRVKFPEMSHVHIFPHTVTSSLSKLSFQSSFSYRFNNFSSSRQISICVFRWACLSRLTGGSFPCIEFSDRSKISHWFSIFPAFTYCNDESEDLKALYGWSWNWKSKH